MFSRKKIYLMVLAVVVVLFFFPLHFCLGGGAEGLQVPGK